jgi:hypothetical protein
VTTALAGSAASLLAGCPGGSGHPPEAPACGAACCVQDPNAHCVTTQGCADSSDCPSGLVCAYHPEGHVKVPLLDMCKASGGVNQCVLPTAAAGFQNRLIDGFPGAQELTLTPDTSQQYTQFTWTAPPDTVVVTCALFGCLPEIPGADAGAARAGTIVNYDQCVLAQHTFGSASNVFWLGDPSYVYDPPPAGAQACSRGDAATAISLPQQITALVVGCWVYDDVQIIAASPLYPITPGESYAYKAFNAFMQEPDECPGMGMLVGHSCLSGDAGAFGTCDCSGRCRPRCLADHDCTEPGQTCFLGAGTAYMGLCEPPSALSLPCGSL